SEKQIVKKILKKLPEEAINLLYFFTQLPENEMQQFVAKSARKTSVSTRQDDVPNSIYNYSSSNAGKLHIENAGLCIIATYFPALFGHLKYLEKGIFKNKAIATRALYLIQYLTTGKSHSPEYLLQFNKLLCGFQLEEDIHANVRLTKKEKMEADDLLQSVIENWSILKNTSLNGFRASFLQRRGILTESEISWTLQVERKSYDMLLSSITWGYGIIKLAWMKKHIQVEW
ncbi:MAG TPA: contractile injection system tape measure protein, partial [Segetibacter sp.]|nr:contractile injection system tape measure protein [Segetibacter sp.]